MKKLLPLIFLFNALISFAQVGIGTTNPDSSSALDVKSTTQGFLMPRMTELQRNAIVAPAAGLFVYNLDFNCFQFYNGSSWSKCLGEVQANKLACSTVATNGVYVFGTPLIPSNTITIGVIVNSIDSYSFTTNTVNGYSFSASGVFSEIGLNTITLVGTGTPILAQTDNFTVSYVGTGLTCNVNNTVFSQTLKNCLEYKNAGSTTDGIYAVDPDGLGSNPAFNCYCDMTNNGGGWTLVFNHNTAGGYWANDTQAELFNISSPGLTTDKYSILSKLDELKSNPAIYEFRLNCPTINKTNHWSQTFDPRSGLSLTNPVPGYVPISIEMTENNWGGLENNSINTYLDGSIPGANWYYSIGSNNAYFGGIPVNSNTSTDKIQLFIR